MIFRLTYPQGGEVTHIFTSFNSIVANIPDYLLPSLRDSEIVAYIGTVDSYCAGEITVVANRMMIFLELDGTVTTMSA